MPAEKIMPIKLAKEELVCGCGGKLARLDAAEVKKLRLRINVSRGIFKCPDCNDVKTVGLTPINDELKKWTEVIEAANDLITSEEEERDSLIDEAIQTLNELPSVPNVERRLNIESLGRIFGCTGMGPSCELYRFASSGLGNLSSICKGKDCKYDPYPKEYKEKEWYGVREADWSGEPEEFWEKRIKSAFPTEVRIDALRRLGSICTPKTEEILIRHLDKKIPKEIRIIAIEALSHFCGERVEWAFVENISSREEPSILKALLAAIRKNDNMSSFALVERLGGLVFYESLKNEIETTLRVIRNRKT